MSKDFKQLISRIYYLRRACLVQVGLAYIYHKPLEPVFMDYFRNEQVFLDDVFKDNHSLLEDIQNEEII